VGTPHNRVAVGTPPHTTPEKLGSTQGGSQNLSGLHLISFRLLIAFHRVLSH